MGRRFLPGLVGLLVLIVPLSAVPQAFVDALAPSRQAPDFRGQRLQENYVSWQLSDNSSDTTVLGNHANGILTGESTSSVAGMLNGSPAFHLTGNQYVTVTIPTIDRAAIQHLWTKASHNPVLIDGTRFGQIVANPTGGWWYFGASGDSIYRWSSPDLNNWTSKTLVLAAAPPPAWDQHLQVASAFQNPLAKNSWILFYRGYDGTTYRMGFATSTDGVTFRRKDNSGVNDGLVSLGANYDPTTVMLVGTRFYIYANGDPTHGTQNIYYTDDQFATFHAAPNNPAFGDGQTFCMGVWFQEGYYYALVPIDLNFYGSSIYDHGLQLWRSSTPFFAPGQRQFLGYAAVNDQTYDARYLDTPTVPMMDVYRSASSPQFSGTVWALYTGERADTTPSGNLMSIPAATLERLLPVVDMRTMVNNEVSFSFWVQLDNIADQSLFSVGNSYNDGSPRWLLCVRGGRLQMFMGSGIGYKDIMAVSAGVSYHIVVSTDTQTTMVYVNGVAAAKAGSNHGDSTRVGALYIGSGYQGGLHGYIRDFQIYPSALTETHALQVYNGARVAGAR